MIINCGPRRIVRDRYGYKIEIRHVLGKDSKRAGEVIWKEDSPAFPASLSNALEVVYERTIADLVERDENSGDPEIDIRNLAAACEHAAQVVKDCARDVRREGNRQATETKEK